MSRFVQPYRRPKVGNTGITGSTTRFAPRAEVGTAREQRPGCNPKPSLAIRGSRPVRYFIIHLPGRHLVSSPTWLCPVEIPATGLRQGA